jgi:vacuolar-type H+-ATPase subunit I/STV1
MLHIATMFGIASRLVLEHRFTLVFRLWIRTALHLALAFGIAIMVYGLILGAVTEAYRPSGPMATMVYGFGLALAGLVAICAGTLAAPDRCARFTFLAINGLAVLFPLGVYAHMALAGELQAGQIWYLIGGFGGSVAAAKLMPWLRVMPQISGV